MKEIELKNGSVIYCYGEPLRFFLGGVHGEERAPVMALESILKEDLQDVWILPCLNQKGFAENNRFRGRYNLNSEFKSDTKLEFMLQLMEIISTAKPKLFVDMHEDVDTYYNYIWTSFDNGDSLNAQVRKFCRKEDIGLLYCPNKWPESPAMNFYRGTSETWARQICPSFTSETAQYNSIDERISMNKKYFEFFMGIEL